VARATKPRPAALIFLVEIAQTKKAQVTGALFSGYWLNERRTSAAPYGGFFARPSVRTLW